MRRQPGHLLVWKLNYCFCQYYPWIRGPRFNFRGQAILWSCVSTIRDSISVLISSEKKLKFAFSKLKGVTVSLIDCYSQALRDRNIHNAFITRLIFTCLTNAVTIFCTELKRIFHISVKFAFDMYQENVSFHLLATPLKYDKISQKTHFIFHFLTFL